MGESLKKCTTMHVICLFFGIALLWCLGASQPCYASLASAQAFDQAEWTKICEIQRQGVIQSVCCTDQYLVTIDNIDDTTETPDVISAYYLHDTDAQGNPVQKYSLAKQVTTTNLEHGNGMAYNPQTNEIIVSLYTNSLAENRGCLYVLDAETLEYKTKVKVSDDFNILGIGYDTENNRYLIQTNVDGGYSFKILDDQFRIVEDLGEYADTAEGDNFQDLCVDGDYIMNFPLTMNMGIGNFLHVYSISQKALVAAPSVSFSYEGATGDEPESICEIKPGHFVAVDNFSLADGTICAALYETQVPYLYQVTVSADHGTVEETTSQVESGKDYTVSYQPQKNYKLDAITVDGAALALSEKQKKGADSFYTVKDIQSDQQITVSFVKMSLWERLATGKLLTVALFIGVIFVALAFFGLLLRVNYVRRVRMMRKNRRSRELQREKVERQRIFAMELRTEIEEWKWDHSETMVDEEEERLSS